MDNPIRAGMFGVQYGEKFKMCQEKNGNNRFE